ncbi:MAG: TonB-dependent receptor, partial [Bacteroidota bacterium]|nr:TonB-dependent receptor [Bacteroidota bacterium]
MEKIKIKMSFFLLVFCLFLPALLNAQTTGKLAGRIVDEKGEPLIGANVKIVGTSLGASTDIDGYYKILNIRAGVYHISVSYVGYQAKEISNIKISSDQTTKQDIALSSGTIVGETITIVATRPIVETNQTSSVSSISEDEINKLPIQDLNEIVNLQAGVIDGHFRGGRIGEVQYQVDGVTVNNPYDNSSTLQLDKSIIQEVQVISGTFDAKYGQAMSGVVNAVLKSGSDKFQYSGDIYMGGFFTTDKSRYPDNNKYKPLSVQNYQLTLSGPTGLPKTTFFISGRKYNNDGWLYGTRRFNPTDSSNFEKRIFNPTGDNKLVPMNTTDEYSGQFKVANQSLEKFQLSYQAIINHAEKQYYNDSYKFNPDGINKPKTFSITHGLDITHTITNDLFYKLSVRQNYFSYKDMKYEDVFDQRYIKAGQPKGDANYENGSVIQGVDLSRFKQETNAAILKTDFTWQFNRFNMFEWGIEGQTSKMTFGSPGFLRSTNVNGVQVLLAQYATRPEDPTLLTYYPKQLAAYLQDRIEMGDLIVRGGIRFEYFDANTTVPSNLQNPANSITGAPGSELVKTKKKIAFAPRLGFSFPLTDRASVYFSYGHFYQMPGLGDLYSNANYLVLKDLQAGGISYGVMGNPDLKPELTVQYEVGLKQALTNSLGLELTFFYKDIRDLLGTEFVSTYTAADYARLTNVDFGSVYGFTIAIDQRAIGPISTSIDYTM